MPVDLGGLVGGDRDGDLFAGSAVVGEDHERFPRAVPDQRYLDRPRPTACQINEVPHAMSLARYAGRGAGRQASDD